MTKRKKSLEFPSTDTKFDSAFTQLMAHLAIPDPNSSAPTQNTDLRLGLNATTQYNPLLAFFGTATTPNTWLYVYPLEKHKATRNGTLTSQKNTLKKAALAIIRPLRISLKAENKTTTGFLSDGDKQYFFIALPTPRTLSAETLRSSNPVPVLSMHSVKHLEHFVDAHDSASSKSTALPEGIYFIWIKRYLGTVAPTTDSQFTHLLFSGKFRNLSNNFPTANLNQTAWYTAAYISTTGAVGDWSPFVSGTITQTS